MHREQLRHIFKPAAFGFVVSFHKTCLIRKTFQIAQLSRWGISASKSQVWTFLAKNINCFQSMFNTGSQCLALHFNSSFIYFVWLLHCVLSIVLLKVLIAKVTFFIFSRSDLSRSLNPQFVICWSPISPRKLYHLVYILFC